MGIGASSEGEEEEQEQEIATAPPKRRRRPAPRFRPISDADLAAAYRVPRSDLSPYGLPVAVRGLGDCLEVARPIGEEASIVRLVYPLCDRPFDVHGFYLVPDSYIEKIESTIVRLRLGGRADVNWVVQRGNPHEHVVVRERELDRRNLERLRKRWSADYARVSDRWE